MFGLEAIVMKENRPVVFVRGNFYDDVGNPWSRITCQSFALSGVMASS